MDLFVEPIAKLINEFSKLPGVGRRSAQRYAYHVIAMSDAEAETFAKAILEVKEKIHYCSVCGNFTDVDPCPVCAGRKSSQICVVKEPKDVTALEKAQTYRGTYHVLHGTLNPMEGIGPEDIRIRELLARVNQGGVDEVILALAADVEGDATSMYLARLLKPFVKVTRIARGIPNGSELEYADEVTLSRAMEDRREL